MKSKIITSVIVFFIVTISIFAQTKTPKFGYTNVDYLLSLMPESKKIESELKTYKSQLEKQAQEKGSEYQEKLAAYQKGAEMMADAVRTSKERELTNLQQEMMAFQQDAEASYTKKQQSALEPVLEKLQKAIDAVAAKSGFTYIFNSDAGYGSTPILLHGPKEDNVSDLILKELGITPPPEKDKEKEKEKK